MGTFVGRAIELEALKAPLSSGSRLSAIYGRRRIGKTRLERKGEKRGTFLTIVTSYFGLKLSLKF